MDDNAINFGDDDPIDVADGPGKGAGKGTGKARLAGTDKKIEKLVQYVMYHFHPAKNQVAKNTWPLVSKSLLLDKNSRASLLLSSLIKFVQENLNLYQKPGKLIMVME
jgi:hypothetical protein